MAAASSSSALFPAFTTTARRSSISKPPHSNPHLSLSSSIPNVALSLHCRGYYRSRRSPAQRISASVAAPPSPEVQTNPDDLVSSIISKVIQTDRGVLLTKDEHKEVVEIAEELQKYCVDAPAKCPLIFGEWDALHCSIPTSPGGEYRSAFGGLIFRIFKINDVIQAVEAPDTIRNKVAFSAFGFLDGEVSVKGKLIALDEKWIHVIFKPPELKVGGLEFKFGGECEGKFQITYIDEKIRLGKGSRGSLFVFQRRS